jgi:endonuclease I
MTAALAPLQSSPRAASQPNPSVRRLRDAQPPTLVGPPQGYYAAAQGKQGAELLSSLHDIISTGHKDNGYSQARDGMFALADDPARNDKVVDIYSGETRPNVSERKSAYAHGLNAEHTWPQSLGARGIAQSDLNQLMSSDIKTNGVRGNFPYGEVVQPDWSNGSGPDASMRGRDAKGNIVFEPRDAVKGDIARGLMYFYTRYNTDRPEDYTLTNFSQELPTLVQWAKQDPVDDRERQRNDDVFSLQNNRNPYIDHPEWIEAAGFPTLQVGR